MLRKLCLAALLAVAAPTLSVDAWANPVTKEDLICITGSFYLVGEAKKYFAAKAAAAAPVGS